MEKGRRGPGSNDTKTGGWLALVEKERKKTHAANPLEKNSVSRALEARGRNPFYSNATGKRKKREKLSISPRRKEGWERGKGKETKQNLFYDFF